MIKETSSWVGLVLADGRYRVAAKLGEGGMGFVYRARDLRLEGDVVIKVPRRAMLEDAEFAGRFTREIRSLVRLAHPHIVKVTDAGEHDGLPFAVMQYLSGGSLRDRQETDPDDHRLALLPEGLRAWLPGVAAALDFIHERRYIHRDVKPDNILFDEHGHAYLSDFGIAKVLAENLAQKPKTVYTGTGMVLGTPQYMAPELIMGEPYDGRVDQYALAVTVYELLSGRLPSEGPTPAAILVQQTTKPPAPLVELVPTISEALSLTVHKALSREPSGRYPSCSAFAQAVLEGASKMAAVPARRLSSAGGATAIPDRITPAYEISCPSCRKLLVLRPASLGKRVRCSSCGKVFQAPAVSKPARTGSAPVASETGRAEEARLDTRATASSPPLVPHDGGALGRDSGEDFPSEASGESALDNGTSGGKAARYLLPAVGLAAVLVLASALALLFFFRKPDAPRQPSQLVKAGPDAKQLMKESTHQPELPTPTSDPASGPPALPKPPIPRQSPNNIPIQAPAKPEPAPPRERTNRPQANRNTPVPPMERKEASVPEDAAKPNSGTPPLPVSPGSAQKPPPGRPDKRLMGVLEKYIRDHTGARALKIEGGHPPVRATRGDKQGLLYKVDVSYKTMNVRDGRYERRSPQSYYLFMVDENIVAGGWDAAKICQILETP